MWRMHGIIPQKETLTDILGQDYTSQRYYQRRRWPLRSRSSYGVCARIKIVRLNIENSMVFEIRSGFPILHIKRIDHNEHTTHML